MKMAETETSNEREMLNPEVHPKFTSPNRKANNSATHTFTAFVVILALGLTVASFIVFRSLLVTSIVGIIAYLFVLSVHIAQEWEKAVILRFGKFNRVVNPGIYFKIPIAETVAAKVDTRTIVTPFLAEEALTADLVPLAVDAVFFWMVWDAKKACIEVEDYPLAVFWTAQTTLRDVIGRVNIDEMSISRDTLNQEIQQIMDEKTTPWGITVTSVEIRDIKIPTGLQNAMSKKAQADREREARVTLAEVEKDISEMFVEAAEIYDRNEKAMQLRTMNLIYESVKDKGGLIVTPSAFSEGFNNLPSNIKDTLNNS